MGLALEVGYLADLLVNDEEGAESFRENLAQLNDYLKSVGLPPHREPEQCEVWSCDMYGYSGIHYLRRVAAHLDLRGELPAPGGEDASKDQVMEQYYHLASQPEPGFVGRIFRRRSRPRTFDHLLLHSDAEGYYLPQDFPKVLFPPEDSRIAGSSVRLLDECRRLATALELPLELDPECDAVWQACESQGEGTRRWQCYGIESYACLHLYAACSSSLKQGAAIVFC